MLNHAKAPLQRSAALAQIRLTQVRPYSTTVRKMHKFRNFVLSSALLLSAGFGGFVWYSLKNDDFYYYFTTYIPFAGIVVDSVDDMVFRRTVGKSSAEKGTAISHPGTKPRETVLVGPDNKANARLMKQPSKPVDALSDSSTSSTKASSTRAKSGSDAAKSPDVEKKAAAPKASKKQSKAKDLVVVNEEPVKPKPVLSAVGMEQVTDTDRLDTKEVDQLLADVSNAINVCMRAHNIDLRSDSFYAGLVSAVKRASNSLKQEREELREHYTEIFHRERDQAVENSEKQYLDAKLNLVEAYNHRLQLALDKVTQKATAATNNRIMSQYVELQREFANDINTRVEDERDGRLGQLKELQRDVDTLQETMLTSGRILESEDGIVRFFVELANLQRVLSSPQSKPLKPYLDALTRALPSDPLVKAVVSSISPTVKRYGVLSHSQLAARFQLIEPEIRRVSLVPPDAGVAGHLSSLAASHLLAKKEGLPDGDDVESVLARAETYLQQGDITQAVSEVNQLQGWSKKVAGDWLDEARKRSEIEFLTNVLLDEGRLWSISRHK